MRSVALVVCALCSRSSRRRWCVAVIAGSFALVQRGSARRTATVAQAGRLAAAVAGGRGAAPGPGAPARAGSRSPRRLGRLPRGAARGARARLADPRVASRVRLARQRHGVQPRRQAAGHGDAGWDDALEHGDVASRRTAAAIVAGRLGEGGLQPRRSDARDRGGKGRVELWDVATRKELRELTDPAAASGLAHALRRSIQPRRQRHRRGPAGDEPRHAVGHRERSGDRPADHHQPARDGRRAVDLLQPGLEADRRSGRSRNRRDLGGRHGAPGRKATRDRERGRGGRRSSPRAAER